MGLGTIYYRTRSFCANLNFYVNLKIKQKSKPIVKINQKTDSKARKRKNLSIL